MSRQKDRRRTKKAGARGIQPEDAAHICGSATRRLRPFFGASQGGVPFRTGTRDTSDAASSCMRGPATETHFCSALVSHSVQQVHAGAAPVKGLVYDMRASTQS